MSSVYITEPGTEGKVLLHTSFGDLDVELWPQQAPKACRNFVQLCLEGVRCVPFLGVCCSSLDAPG
jgi:peptidyl-prolyl cis-trans isomerase SDCCAG10